MDFQTRYEFNPKTDLLGKGGFSKVYKANDILLDRTVALKFFIGNGAEKYQVLNEIKKVIRFEHPNLCKYYDVAVLNSKNVVGETETIEVGIMEYLDAGDFKTYLKNNPHHVDKLLMDVLKGLSYLHKKGIVHRDLKPQNIIIKIVDDEPVAKITDFGISKLISSDDNNSSALIGTIEYMAPEQFNPKKYGIGGRITTNLDLWSFGLLVYEALQHKPLFGSRSSGTSAEQVMRNILSESYLTRANLLPSKYRAIVKRCLVKYASERAQTALELIPLFSDASVAPENITGANGAAAGSHGLNKNTKGNEPLHEPIIEQEPTLVNELEEDNDNTQVIDPDPDLENADLPEVPEDNNNDHTLLVQPDKAGTPDNGTQLISVEDSVADDHTQLLLFRDQISTEHIGAGLVKEEDANEGTQVLDNVGNVTGENTQILQFREEILGDTIQTTVTDDRQGNADQTDVIRLVEKVDDDNTTLIHTPHSLPNKDVFQPIHNNIDIDSSPFQKLLAKIKTLASKNNKVGNAVLYSIIPLLFIIGFFVFRRLNASDKIITAQITAATKSKTSGFQPLLITTPELTRVDGGGFTMGNDKLPATTNGLTPHKVMLSNFLIGKYEVTIDQFRQFVNDTRYFTTAEMQGKSAIYKNGNWETAEHVNWRYDINGKLLDTVIKNIPVVHVSWLDASKYCEWLSGRNHKRYRLPTEAEWEFAARGGNNSKNFIYSGSDTIGQVAWFQENSGNKIQGVGQKQANELGIYDMSGNVMEWCNDAYDEYYYLVSPTDNPPGPDSGTTRVVRGGSWFIRDRKWFRNSFRAGYSQETSGGQLGFRICEVLQ